MLEVPDKTIQIIPLKDGLHWGDTLEKLRAPREWFDAHMYKCLPLSIANQYGFIVKAPYDFTATWVDADPMLPYSVEIDRDEEQDFDRYPIVLENTFGRGILTIYPRFLIRTAPLISTWVRQPPNFIKEGVDWLEGVVETDNLKSSFTFNIKFHEKNKPVYFKQGDPLGCFMPYPRFFYDDFQVDFVEDQKTLNLLRDENEEFLRVRRREVGTGASGFHYRKGEDFQGCPFPHKHQVVVNMPVKDQKEE